MPHEPGIVMIDIDSCDIFVFLSLTKVYRPRVVQIEYNRHFSFDDKLALDCRDGGPNKTWDVSTSDIYGASIKAIADAGESRGYQVVWLERCFDVFLIRQDLICQDTKLPNLEMFRSFTAVDGGCPDPWGYFANPVPKEQRFELLLDFRTTALTV